MDLPRGIRIRGEKLVIEYQRDGIRRFETLDLKPTAANVARAREIRRQRIVDLAAGVTPEQSARSNPTFGELAQTYLDGLRASPSAIRSYHQILTRYWMPSLGAELVRSIRYRDLLAAASTIAADVSAKTFNNALVPLRGVFRLALADDLIDSDPSAKLRRAPRQKPEVDPVTPAEWELILPHLDGDARDWLTLVWETGLRTPSEVAALRWSDIHEDRLVVSRGTVRRLDKASTKTNQARDVLLTPAARAVLRNRPTRFAGGPVFWRPPSPYLPEGGPYLDGDEINEAWKVALEKAGVRYRRAYNLRHGFASRALSAGANPAWLARHLGHSLEMLLNVYGRWITGDQDRAELDKLSPKTDASRGTAGK